MHRAPLIKICTYRVNRRLPDWDNALASTLPEESHRPLTQINSIKVEVNNLANAPA